MAVKPFSHNRQLIHFQLICLAFSSLGVMHNYPQRLAGQEARRREDAAGGGFRSERRKDLMVIALKRKINSKHQ
jgi:hypothetical protein